MKWQRTVAVVAALGLTRRFSKRVSGSLRYGFSQYSEPSSGNMNNFTAHGIFATLDYRWP